MGMEKQVLVWQFSMNVESGLLYFRKTFRQLLSYALIGVLTNVSGYAVYLLLTYLWDSPKVTMTLLYLVGASIGFLANRRFTFRHDGHIGSTGVRYLLVQVAGYLLNLVLLLLFVDWSGFPHQIVQAIAIVVVAIFLFIMLRVFVFTPLSSGTGATRP